MASEADRQMKQTLVLLKSMVSFSAGPLKILLGGEPEALRNGIVASIDRTWPQHYRDKLVVEYFPIWYPEEGQRIKYLYKACTTQRLFFHQLLAKEDAVVYLDTDLIFLDSVEKLWQEFGKFNASQVIGMVPNLFHYNNPEANKVPFYGETGLSAGVMLFNLTRIRALTDLSWTREVMAIFDEYRNKIVYADQDILNIFFSKYPEKAYEISCRWNFRMGQCMLFESRCRDTPSKSVAIVHGVDSSFEIDMEYKFVALFRSWRNFKLGSSFRTLYVSLRQRLKEISVLKLPSFCRKNVKNIDELLTRGLRKLAYQS